jgi:hypothetical protein
MAGDEPMARKRTHKRAQFSVRSLLAAITWSALVIAICVGQQQAATRQRQAIEQLKAAGMLPLTYINGRPVAPAHRPAPTERRTF